MRFERPSDQKDLQRDWDGFTVAERALQWARYLCDTVKVKEVGANRGYWVEKFLRICGLGPGYAWCAAFVTWCLKKAGQTDLPKRPAAVISWFEWGKATGRLIERAEVKRGDLVGYLNSNGTGHIWFCTEKETLLLPMRTIEGNTNSGGSREGDRAARRKRFWRQGYFAIRVER